MKCERITSWQSHVSQLLARFGRPTVCRPTQLLTGEALEALTQTNHVLPMLALHLWLVVPQALAE